MSETACAVCVLNAIRRGVNSLDTDNLVTVGQKIADGTQVHAAVTTMAGTPVCFYHVDDAAKAVGL